MAWDNFVCTYHLTKHGWKMGDEAPNDAVWTVTERTYQRSGFSSEQVSWYSARLHASVENIRSLLNRYPCPVGNPISTAQTLGRLLAESIHTSKHP